MVISTSLFKIQSGYKFLILFLGICFCVNSQKSYSQTSGVTPKYWKMVGENDHRVDVWYLLTQCGSINQVHLKLFNESLEDRNAKFQVEVINTVSKENFFKQINILVPKVQGLEADCSDASSGNLKIDLPKSYDPRNVSVIITFK